MAGPTQSKLAPGQIQQWSFCDLTKSATTQDGFLLGTIGRKIVITASDSVTDLYTYKEGATTLYAITVVYTDSTKATISSVERTA